MWDDRYGADEYAYGTEPNDFLRDVAAHLTAGPILCLAEGEGRNAVFLASRGLEVTAVDGSIEGVRKTERLAKERGVPVNAVHADLAHYSIEPGAWAGVISIFGHLPPPLRRTVHAAAVQGLRTGGVLVLEAYTPDQLQHRTGGPPVAEMMMTLEGLRDELAGLELVIGREVVREVHEGKYHHGTAATVQILGRRAG